MDIAVTVDLAHVARDLGLPTHQVQRTVDLLDEGNTIPFVTRYRKDQTGGLDEEQIRRIQDAVERERMLAERKQTILKSIESQGRLTDELAAQIRAANSTKRLEDLYLPYKPKKQTLATIARQRGLAPLAHEVYVGHPAARDLEIRASDFVDPDKGLFSTADVLLGVGHLLAEQFSERADLRSRLRRILYRTGKLVSTHVDPAKVQSALAEKSEKPEKRDAPRRKGRSAAPAPMDEAAAPDACATAPAAESPATVAETSLAAETSPPQSPAGRQVEVPPPSLPADSLPAAAEPPRSAAAEPPPSLTAEPPPPSADEPPSAKEADPSAEEPPPGPTMPYQAHITPPDPAAKSPEEDAPTSEAPHPAGAVEAAPSDYRWVDAPPEMSAAVAPPEVPAAAPAAVEAEAPAAAEASTSVPPAAVDKPLAAARPAGGKMRSSRAEREEQKKKKKEKERELKEKSFKDYYDYSEPISQVPPHRILAVNRGERAKVLRVRIEADFEAMHADAEELLVPRGHVHADFLRECARDALQRLVIPSLEREIRRELTEQAEAHAVEVFAQNLRKLLLAPPVRGRRVLAVDPGFRSGCKVVALDEFGNILGHGVVFLIGREEHRRQSRARLVEMIQLYRLSVVAIGNGTACREAEELVADVIAHELHEADVAYTVVNEAGASVYSTSAIGREELPDYDATVRSAVSIGRRLLDPLSELVKINPSNIGVGLYQHDVKAKHLRASLDAVVESCVNYVGVDVNTASPALLRYVSGLNQLTARRLYDYRLQNGPFKSRDELLKVPGFGAATFVQAAGFLKVTEGENPLDATWIHPESYATAVRVLEKLGSSVEELAARVRPAPGRGKTSAALASEPSPDEAAEDAMPADPQASAVGEAAAAAPSSSPAGPPTVVEAEEWTSLAERIAQVDCDALARELDIGVMLLRDILTSLTRPGRDPRDDLPRPIFRRGIMKLEDLEPGMELEGTVLNVVDFGAFVDIGLHDSGLVHISRLANKFIRDPHEVVSVGDVLKVWVVGVDKQRRRVSLTAIPPDAKRPERPPRQRRGRKPPQEEGGPPKPPVPQDQPPPRGQQRRQGQPSGQGRLRRREDQSQRGRGRPSRSTTTTSKPRPKPITPITKEMEEGREPMRSFSDLQQFWQRKMQQGESGEAEKG